jgi:hypothetical protein
MSGDLGIVEGHEKLGALDDKVPYFVSWIRESRGSVRNTIRCDS